MSRKTLKVRDGVVIKGLKNGGGQSYFVPDTKQTVRVIMSYTPEVRFPDMAMLWNGVGWIMMKLVPTNRLVPDLKLIHIIVCETIQHDEEDWVGCLVALVTTKDGVSKVIQWGDRIFLQNSHYFDFLAELAHTIRVKD